ncbi:unnamed protein product [Arabidopsis thaliana]|nr:unnamed protein product [Arabidopsis thaliana]VYS64065.1 unnamed protein product [Arabidopsis thaliana]
MRERCGCAMFGCSVSVPNTAESYCCDSHKTMATQMDSISGSPCIVFDGLKTVDVTLSTALLHRTRGRLAVGVPTLPATVFSVPPWSLGPEFHPQPLSDEASRSWAFFCVNPPKAGDFPAMAETSYSWRKKEHWYLRLSTDVVYVVRHSVLGHSTSPKPQGDWGLLRYSHLGTDLFCLTLNASRPSCQRLSEANEEGSGSAANEEGSGSAANEEGSGSAANEEGSGLQNEFDTLIRALLKIGQRKRKGRIAVTHGKQWGGSYEEILNSRESKAGFRELVNKLGADALTEDLELELRYEIEGLTENAIAWFNQNDNAAFDDWKAKLIEFQTALSKLKEK